MSIFKVIIIVNKKKIEMHYKPKKITNNYIGQVYGKEL